jgi:predicted nucleotide-binding protein
MSTDRIKCEVRDLQNALSCKDISAINDLVRYGVEWFGEMQKDKHLVFGNQRDQISYDKAMRKYERLINRSINEMNSFVKAETIQFIDSHSKAVLLAVVENLISIEKISLSLTSKRQLVQNLLKFLSIAKDEEGDAFQQACDILSLQDPDFADRDPRHEKITLFVQNVKQQFLKDLVRESFGKNYIALKNFSSVKIPDDIDIKLDCTIHKRKCDQFIPSRNTFFLAFPFNRQDIENSVVEACKIKFTSLKPVIAKNTYENLTALCQICKMILSARFGIYVLTKDSQREDGKYVPNPNVMLELGLAMGAKKRTILLLDRGTTVPADLQGNLRIEFNDTKDIPSIIEKTNFEKIWKR